MNFSNILLSMNSVQAGAQAGSQAGAQAADNGGMTLLIVIFLAFMIVYMFVVSRKDKKQQQAEKDMRENIKIGDEILTIGGVLGRVVTVKEDSVVIETGADRTKIRFTKQAIGKNISAEARAAELKNAKIAAAKKSAADKKASKKSAKEEKSDK